jgi:uncharacterized membrane protein YsdA (DUF1294 family)
MTAPTHDADELDRRIALHNARAAAVMFGKPQEPLPMRVFRHPEQGWMFEPVGA